MLAALFQRIPRCLFEPIAVLAVIGLLIWACRHWQKARTETVFWGAALLFMLAWRLLMPINADRYALLLVPAAVFFAVYAVEEIIAECRKHFRCPDFRWFWGILLVCCLVKSFHGSYEDRKMFGLIRCLKTNAPVSGEALTVVSNRDVSIFLGDRFQVEVRQVHSQLQFFQLPEARYYLLRLDRKTIPEQEMPGFREWKRFRKPNGKLVYVLWEKEKTR